MPIDFLNHINLNKNQLQNVVIHPLGTAPPSPVEGQMYTDTTNGSEAVYAYLGTDWISLLNSTTVSVTDESSDVECFPLFVTAATGDLAAKSGTNLTFNSSTGLLSATGLAGILDSGSITSGFGSIDNGTSGIRTNTFTAETSYVASADNAVAIGTSSAGFTDLFLSDSGEIQFGADQDVKLTHVPDVGLTLANTNTGDDKPIVFQLKSTESTVAASEVIGSIEFAATDTNGGDGTGVCAGIHAIATSSFTSSANPTKLVFTTGNSEAANSSATAKMTLDPTGSLTVAHDLTLSSDSSIISLGAGNDFTITHSGTGATIAGNPVNITAGGSSTWKASAGDVTIDSEAGAVMLDGHTGVAVASETGEIDITATAGDIDINAGDNVFIDAADNIYLTTTSADGLLKLHSAHTAGQAILIDANANADSTLDIDAGILDIDIQGVASIDSGGTLSLATANSGVAVTIGHTTSEVTIGDNLTVTGDLTVSGTTTTVNSTTVDIVDKNISLGTGTSGVAGDDAAVNGGGVTLKSTDSDKTWNWINATDSWTSNQHIDIVSTGTDYKIAGTSVLNATTLGSGVVTSSLTTVGALNSGSITSGFGAINNGSSTITTTGAVSVGSLVSTGTITGNGFNAALAKTFTLNDDESAGNNVASENNGAASSYFTITHGMGASRNYKVEVVQVSDYATVFADVTRPSDTTIRVTFAADVALGAYLALVTKC